MEQNKAKEFYLMVKGQKVIVTEEVYRAYVRPVRAEQKRKERESRCLIEKVVNDKTIWVVCEENCSKCEKNKMYNRKCSLEGLEGHGFDVPDTTLTEEESLLEQEIKREEISNLHTAINNLPKKYQKIIKLIYFEGKTQKEVANIYGIDKTTMSKLVKVLLKKIKNFL